METARVQCAALLLLAAPCFPAEAWGAPDGGAAKADGGVAIERRADAKTAPAKAPPAPKLTPAQKEREKALTKGWASKPPPEGGAVELKLVKVLKVGRWPKGVELTPDGKEAVVTNFSDNTLSFIDTATLKTLATLRTGKPSPVEVIYFPDGKRAVIPAGWQTSETLVLDLETRKIVKTIDGLGTGPKEDRRVFPKVAAFSPDGSKLFVTYWSTNNVGVYDGKTFEHLATVKVGVNPRGIAVTPDGKKVYVCNFDNVKKDAVTVFQAEKPFKVLKNIPNIPNPRHVAISKDGKFAYVSRFGGRGGVVKIDTAKDEVVASSVDTGWRGKTLKLSPDGRWVFLTNFGADSVSVFDSETLEEVARYPTGKEPCGLDVSQDGKTLWTTDWEDDRVRIWDIIVNAPPKAAPDAGMAGDGGTPAVQPAAPDGGLAPGAG